MQGVFFLNAQLSTELRGSSAWFKVAYFNLRSGAQEKHEKQADSCVCIDAGDVILFGSTAQPKTENRYGPGQNYRTTKGKWNDQERRTGKRAGALNLLARHRRR